MMRVGTQKRSKSNSSPQGFRQSPVNRHSSSSPSNTAKNTLYNSYRQNASPVLEETYKIAHDYHRQTVNEQRTSGSPHFRTSSPGYNNSSPTYGRDSPDYISSKRLNERRFETSSPSFGKNDSSYANKMSSMRISDTRSPSFMDRPDVGGAGGYSSTNSRYEKRVTETSRNYSNNNSFNDGIDSRPIVKLSTDNQASLRRDSWDAISKTKNMLSDRSLESLANLTESQLDTEIRKKRSEEQSRYTSNNAQQTQTNYITTKKYNIDDYGERYGRNSPIYKVGLASSGGASSVKVQPVPDGVLGQPVEFESKFARGVLSAGLKVL